MKKSERLNQELIFLSDKYAFQLKDLMTEFAISKRTALRDIEELESIGLALYAESGRHGGYRLINQLPLIPIYFNNEEIQAIFFALDALKLISNTPFEKSYTRIEEKLMTTLSPERKGTVADMLAAVHYYNVPPVNNTMALKSILTAILQEKVVHTRYIQYGTENIQLQIYELFYRNGIWFTSAWNLTMQRWGTYRCDYMTELSIDDTVVAPFSRQDLTQLQTNYESTYHNIPFRCRLTPFGKELFLKNHYPNMKLETINGIPYMTGGYNQEELAYMTHFLVSLGKHVTIEFPEQLKQSYLTELQNMLNRYK
ncbi:transcriptional regulator [Secundilactobacillus oryzae JCM 18671]|uniref:Transcriptional regulator n=1 Tax=Secundilactobacillus oryzae JCM 18671 TaxID=1291743 RepID=A0A081BJW5_9LACO|nr:WYL domain-containing protein [Secundilactobacillus oryzae]GAK48333.1 transcriptional regulator [Secundilactobacillus oryzae JCM 18671]